MAKNYVLAIPMTSIDAATFTGNYQAINTDGLPEACSLIRIVNDTNRDITISYDGVDPHDYIPAVGRLELNLQANSQPSGYVSALRQGAVVYIAAAAGAGFVYLAGYYNPKN